MTDSLKHGLRQHGGAWSLAVLCLCLLVIARPPWEYVATARVKLDFDRTNQPSMNPFDCATNGAGWKPILTEAKVIRSEIVVRKTLHRLSPASAQTNANSATVALAMDRLESSRVTEGIQLRGFGTDPEETARFVNTVAEVYREERNKLWPAPPGCRDLSISLSHPATPRLNLSPLFRFALGAASLALMVALRFGQQAKRFQDPFLRLLVFWFCLLLGLALLLTPLSVALAFMGATLFALLLAAGFSCIDWVMSQNPPVPPKLLTWTFSISCIVLIGPGILMTIIRPDHSFATAQVRVSVEQDGTHAESQISYDPRFIATECEVIQSRTVLGRVVMDQPVLAEALNRMYGRSLSQRDGEEHGLRATSVRPVGNTSLIDITYWNPTLNARRNVAGAIAELYQRYWDERSKTNLARRVNVVLLGSSDSPRRLARQITGRSGQIASNQLVLALFVLGGSLCGALLARKPVRLWLILVLGVVYAGLLGIAAIASSLISETSVATSLVRIWPSAVTHKESNKAEKLLLQECEHGVSVEVLANAVQVLDANTDFPKQHRESWRLMDNPGRQSWLKERLKVVPVADTFLMRFEASSDNPNDAAEIANAAAAAYCDSKAGADERTIDEPARVEVEILDRAVPALRPREVSNPLEKGLTNGLGFVACFLVGAVIAALGCLVETARRARATEPVPEVTPRIEGRW